MNWKMIAAALAAAALLAGTTWWLVNASAEQASPPVPPVDIIIDTPVGPSPDDDGHDHGAAVCTDEPGGTGMHGDVAEAPEAEGVEPIPPCAEVMSALTSEQMRELYRKRGDVEAFLRAWFEYSTDERVEHRDSRLQAAGGAGALAGSTSATSRSTSAQTGLSAQTRLGSVVGYVPADADEYGRSVLVTVNVVAQYRLPSGRGTDWTLGGHVTVWLDESDRIVRVEESFPDLAGMV